MIISWSQGVADDNMDEAILVELGSIITRHPWWAARGELLLSLLRRFGHGVPVGLSKWAAVGEPIFPGSNKPAMR